MNARAHREVTPADVRALRQLGAEVQLCLETAIMNPARFRPFVSDALRHVSLLVDLSWVLFIETAHIKLRSLPHWARCELQSSRGHRRVWRHRVAHVRDAIRILGQFEAAARRLESELWDG